jgi:hypothetical protein
MLTTLNILAILLGMTIVGLVGYFVIKTIINRSQKPNPPSPTPSPTPCSSSNCASCKTKDSCTKAGCTFDGTKCSSTTPTPPPSPPSCSSTNCNGCKTEEACHEQAGCIYDTTNNTCKNTCNIPQDQRINVPGCGKNCGVESTCVNSPGKPCFEAIDNDPKNYPWCYIRNGKKCQTPPSIDTSVKLSTGTDKCASAQAGGSGKCSDLVPNPNAFPQNVTLDNSNVKNGTSPFNIQYSDLYTQYWTTIDGGNNNMPTPTKDTPACSGDTDGVCLPNNNVRAIAVTVPKTQMPQGGYPYVLSWQFMNRDGYGMGWKQYVIGGIAEMDLDGEALGDDAGSGLASYMLMLKYIVSAGYVLVNISELVYDTEFWMDCGNSSNNSVDQMCWNNGHNVDADAMRVLFDKIKNNNLITDINNLKLNYDNMAVLGYSVGAQQVSRMINNFPFMKISSGLNFPTIKLGIMIGGGSYWCYNYDGKGNMTGPIPDNFKPCNSPPNIGCCPRDISETNYDNGKLQNHPPVLLLQGVNDRYAAWEASSNYFNILSSRGDPVYRVMGPTIQSLKVDNVALGRHGVYGCQIPAVVALLKLYV